MLEKLQSFIIQTFTDAKAWAALTLAPMLKNFYGPSWEFISIIGITALADVWLGYLKNKKVKGEKFSFSKTRAKGAELIAAFILLSLANYNDPMFMKTGLNQYSVGVTICVAYGIWQFLRCVSNASTWFPEDLREIIKDKIKEKIGIENENKE